MCRVCRPRHRQRLPDGPKGLPCPPLLLPGVRRARSVDPCRPLHRRMYREVVLAHDAPDWWSGEPGKHTGLSIGVGPAVTRSAMTELHIRQPAPVPTTAGAMGRALAGGLIMAVALGVGNGLGPVLADATGASGLAARLIAAGLVTVVAVPI